MPENLSQWVGLALSVIALAGIVWGWATAGDKKAVEGLAGKIKGVGDKLDDHEKRIQSMEGEMKHLPSKDMVHDLQMTMKDIQIEMANLKAETQGAARASRRVEEYLIEKASKAA